MGRACRPGCQERQRQAWVAVCKELETFICRILLYFSDPSGTLQHLQYFAKAAEKNKYRFSYQISGMAYSHRKVLSHNISGCWNTVSVSPNAPLETCKRCFPCFLLIWLPVLDMSYSRVTRISTSVFPWHSPCVCWDFPSLRTPVVLALGQP